MATLGILIWGLQRHSEAHRRNNDRHRYNRVDIATGACRSASRDFCRIADSFPVKEQQYASRLIKTAAAALQTIILNTIRLMMFGFGHSELIILAALLLVGSVIAIAPSRYFLTMQLLDTESKCTNSG